MSARKMLIAIWLECGKDWGKTYKALCDKRYPNMKVLDGVEISEFITIFDNDYPEELKSSYQPPFVIEKGE